MHTMSTMLQDKTFFITQNGKVKTYHATVINAGNIEILVYDRTSPSGLDTLNPQDIRRTITEGSKSYNADLKSFIQFLARDLKNRPDLASYIFAIWNGNTQQAQELYDEDCCLPDDFCAYLEVLKVREEFDMGIVLYFEEVFYTQSLVYDVYNVKWLAYMGGPVVEPNRQVVEEI